MKKFTICLGLFDKITKKQEISTLEAFKIASNIFAERTGGATITEGRGVYTHNNGTLVIEPTLVCIVFDTDINTIKSVSDTLKTVFNQESVIIEETEVNSMFY